MIRIASSLLAVDILPEIGGKIGQIRDRATGHEFLIAPQKPWRTIPASANWLDYDTSGMDDCFPNIASGLYPLEPWKGMLFPDLGEWTHETWDVLEARAQRVTLQRDGTLLPYRAQKEVGFLDERTLLFSWRVENRGLSAFRYMWAAHPLIATEGKYELALPEGELTFRVFPPDGAVHPWPIYQGVNLQREWIRPGTDVKIFIAGLTEGWCELRLPMHSLRFEFDLSTTAVLGIWFNNSGFPASGTSFRCVAVEPCTSSSDVLDDLQPSEYPQLAPGERAAWWLRLRIVPRSRTV